MRLLPGRRWVSSIAVAGLAAGGALAACAQTAPTPAPLVTVRVLVKLTRASDDDAAIAADASRVAGVPVHYAAATSYVWHSLALECASREECDAAVARLRAAKSAYAVVERDERKRGSSM